MNKSRLEAFSDGVMAIIITIMVLELKLPHGAAWAMPKPLIPTLISYAISFTVVGIYWGNHHHLLQSARQVDSRMMLSNLLVLFWLSLIPAATAWMGQNEFAPNTIVAYAVVLILSSFSWSFLQNAVRAQSPRTDELEAAYRKLARKATVSVVSCFAAIPLAYVHPALSAALFLIYTGSWLIPDRSMEQAIKNLPAHKLQPEHPEKANPSSNA